jgi:hypothetical protein
MREVSTMSTMANANSNSIEPTIRALGQLSSSSQGAVMVLVRQLAEREGIGVALTGSSGIQVPAEGIPLWPGFGQAVLFLCILYNHYSRLLSHMAFGNKTDYSVGRRVRLIIFEYV